MIAVAFGVMLLGKADNLLVERLRTTLSDALAPIYGAISQPVNAVEDAIAEIQSLGTLRSDNARLREENERLRRWHAAALSLEAENTLLRRQLGFVPEAAPNFHAARVVADGGGTYARAVLLSIPPQHGIRKGQVALDERGFVGRVTEVGARSARVLLATDMNSRVPVTLEGSRARGDGRHEWRPPAPGALARRGDPAGRRKGCHQRPGQCLPGWAAGWRGAAQRAGQSGSRTLCAAR